MFKNTFGKGQVISTQHVVPGTELGVSDTTVIIPVYNREIFREKPSLSKI